MPTYEVTARLTIIARDEVTAADASEAANQFLRQLRAYGYRSQYATIWPDEIAHVSDITVVEGKD